MFVVVIWNLFSLKQDIIGEDFKNAKYDFESSAEVPCINNLYGAYCGLGYEMLGVHSGALSPLLVSPC